MNENKLYDMESDDFDMSEDESDLLEEEILADDINEENINNIVNERLKNICKENQISKVHPRIFFYYNSFNVILGKQGTGKTTFVLKELMKLNNLNTKYKRIIYVSDGGGKDNTFIALKSLIKIPIYVLSFEEATNTLKEYFGSSSSDEHNIIILEDGSFLFEKKNDVWGQWICKLRHLKTTVFINVHIWRGINSMLKTQISNVIVFKGFSKEIIQRVVSQTSSDCVYQTVLYLYLGMSEDKVLKIDNIKGKISIIKK